MRKKWQMILSLQLSKKNLITLLLKGMVKSVSQ